nr:50S ribosomal protein L17-like [Tanacetum cinerariifolium]
MNFGTNIIPLRNKEDGFYSICNINICSPVLQLLHGTLCAARRAVAFVRGDDVIHKLFTELAYQYKSGRRIYQSTLD